MIKRDAMLTCGYCALIDKYTIKTSTSNGKRNVSGAVSCRKCGRDLNHKNKLSKKW